MYREKMSNVNSISIEDWNNMTIPDRLSVYELEFNELIKKGKKERIHYTTLIDSIKNSNNIDKFQNLKNDKTSRERYDDLLKKIDNKIKELNKDSPGPTGFRYKHPEKRSSNVQYLYAAIVIVALAKYSGYMGGGGGFTNKTKKDMIEIIQKLKEEKKINDEEETELLKMVELGVELPDDLNNIENKKDLNQELKDKIKIVTEAVGIDAFADSTIQHILSQDKFEGGKKRTKRNKKSNKKRAKKSNRKRRA